MPKKAVNTPRKKPVRVIASLKKEVPAPVEQELPPPPQVIKAPEEAIPADPREKYMSLGDHLEELRQRIIRGILSVLLVTIALLFFGEEVHTIFASPYKKVLGPNATFFQIKLMAPLLIYLKTSFIVGVLFCFPYLLFLLWGFIAPAVEAKTEKHGKLLILFATLLFWSGLAICWYTVFENFLRIFLVMFRPPDVDMKLPIDEYYDIFFNIHLIFGLSFELPVVLIILGRIGIISSNFLMNKWREATVILSVFAAVFSPGPDVFSMMMLFVPLLFLFFLSIGIMKFTESKED